MQLAEGQTAQRLECRELADYSARLRRSRVKAASPAAGPLVRRTTRTICVVGDNPAAQAVWASSHRIALNPMRSVLAPLSVLLMWVGLAVSAQSPPPSDKAAAASAGDRINRLLPRHPPNPRSQLLRMPRPKESPRPAAARREGGRAQGRQHRTCPRRQRQRRRASWCGACSGWTAKIGCRSTRIRCPKSQIALLRSWIDQGAAWPDDGATTGARAAGQRGTGPTARRSRPAPRRSRAPTGSRTRSTRSSWRASRKRAASRRPRPARRLLRRVSLDLIGLPPTLEEVDAFLADARPTPTSARRPAARLAALRRALGAAVARPRPLRRHQRLREGRAAHDVEVPRLGDRGAQRRHAVRPLHDRADRRRHAAERDRRPAHRHRLPPQHACSTRRAASTSRRRAWRRCVDRVNTTATVWLGQHDRVRPVPQPQVRPVLAEGLLPADGVLRQRRVLRSSASQAATTGSSSRRSTCRRPNRRASAQALRRSSTSLERALERARRRDRRRRRPRWEQAIAGPPPVDGA